MGRKLAPAGMRRVTADELAIGRVLAAPLRDHTGRVLVRAGERLSERHMGVLARHGAEGIYTDQTSSSSSRDEQNISPEELMYALRLRKNPAGRRSRRIRQRERYDWKAELRVLLELQQEGFASWREVTVNTCDISSSGYSFICEQYVHVGTVVHARFEMLPRRPALKGVVRNCVHLGGREHRVGVEFVRYAPGEKPPLR